MRLAATVLALLALLPASAAATSLTPHKTTSWYAGEPGPFLNPQGIATSPAGDFVYVADTGNNRIVQYTSNGLIVRVWGKRGSGRRQFKDPTSVATDPDGNVYVADSGNSRVQKFTSTGKPRGSFDAPFVHDVATDRQGHLFILSTFFQLVSVRTYAGAQVVGWRATFPDKFFPFAGYGAATNDVSGLATDRAGRVYVAGHSRQSLESPEPDCHNVIDAQPHLDHRPYVDPLVSGALVRFSRTGTPEAQAWLSGSPIDCTRGWFSFGDPNGVAVDPSDGAVYTAQREHFIGRFTNLEAQKRGGPERLQMPCPACGPNPEPNFGSPTDLAFDCRSNLYVMTPDRVLKYHHPLGSKAPRDKCPPTFADLVVSDHLRQAGKNALSTILDCQATKPCTGKLELSGEGKSCKGSSCEVDIGATEFNIRAGTTKAIRIPLDAAARKLIAGKDAVDVEAVARVKTGNKRRVRKAELLLRDPSSLSLGCAAGATSGSPLSLPGKLSESGPGKATAAAVSPVNVLFTSPLGFTVRRRVTVGKDGRFRVGFTPDIAGTWTMIATWRGDRTNDPAQARGCNLEVQAGATPGLQSTSLTLSCPTQSGGVPSGVPAAFPGNLSPPLRDRTVRVEFKAPSGATQTSIAYTDANGAYTASFTPPRPPGSSNETWTAQARWGGDAAHQPATSASCSFDVYVNA